MGGQIKRIRGIVVNHFKRSNVGKEQTVDDYIIGETNNFFSYPELVNHTNLSPV